MPRLRGAERMRLARGLLLVALALALAACARTRLHLTEDLWQKWQAMDTLMQSDYPEAVPIVLVHGWNGSEFSWPDAQRLAAVEKRLGRDIYYFSYRSGVLTGRFPPLEIVEEELERYLRGFRRVDIVAHSMGGLLVRQYLRHHGSRRIRRLVFLATPHFGAEAAGTLAELAGINPAGSLQADELQPGSDFLWQLDIGEGRKCKACRFSMSMSATRGWRTRTTSWARTRPICRGAGTRFSAPVIMTWPGILLIRRSSWIFSPLAPCRATRRHHRGMTCGCVCWIRDDTHTRRSLPPRCGG
jgi:Predicted acetyltransferases and hydrolases with the alpha/beta hydrolase fold